MRTNTLLAALLLSGVIACSDDDDGGPTGNTPPTGDIIVGNNFFNPADFTAEAGAEVVWTWASGADLHNVTFDDGPNSPDQSSGTYARTFDAEGSYPYHCTIHGPSMSGVVTVGAPASAGTPGGPGY